VAAPTIERPAPPAQAAVPPPVLAPAPKATVAQQPKAVDEGRERLLTDQYRQIISAKIKRYEDYPVVAKRRHWEGTTVVQLSISPDGKIEAISVVEKSGHEVLDDAAVKMIRKAVPLPIPPEGLRTVLIPIKFRLDS
jgi:protein TonB